MKKYFKINVNRYVKSKDFDVVRPASLNYPRDNAVMFIIEKRIGEAHTFKKCNNCLIFWPENIDIPEELDTLHAIYKVADPHKEYCRFFYDNKITYLPIVEEFEVIEGAYICRGARIGDNCHIFPGAYISGESEIGDDVYIGSGARLIGEVHIGNNVIIRENAVIGADGLSTDRDENGKALTMPQFGGTVLEDDVQIGAMTVIARGAIDNTIIRKGSKVDNSSFISHNVVIGEDTFVVGETIMFGSSSTGNRAYISGNATIRDGRHIGADATVGMGSLVVKDVNDGCIVKGNPAK